MEPTADRAPSPLVLPPPALTKNSDRWIFTVPQYTEADEQEITWHLHMEPNIRYCVVGVEYPRIAGFIFLKEPRTLEWMNRLIRANFEVALYPHHCVEYCKSFGEYHEIGHL